MVQVQGTGLHDNCRPSNNLPPKLGRTVLKLVGIGLALGLTALSGCGSEKVVTPVPNQREFLPVGGENQAAFIRHELPLPLAVMVKNADGSVAPNINIDWVVKTGGGTLSSARAVTDAEGIASVTWTLGRALGAQSVTASAPGLNVSTLTFSATGRPLPMVLNYTGSDWGMTLVDTTNVGAVLTSIWGAGASNVFAVGKCQDTPLKMGYNGTVWTVPNPCARELPCDCAFVETYTSVWGNSASDVFAVRQYVHTMHAVSAIDHFDGQSWTQTYLRTCEMCALTARAVWTGAAGSAIAVGDSGSVLRYDGASWNSEPSGTTAHLRAIWGAGASGPVFAVGEAGTILINNGSGWTAQTSGTTQPLYAVWGTSGTDVFAVGGAGTILHYNGTSWTAQSNASTATLRGLWGNSGSSVFAVGDGTTILHYDGSNWAPQPVNAFTNPSMNLTGVWGVSPTNVLAVGSPL
jgi:hypothetical protein